MKKCSIFRLSSHFVRPHTPLTKLNKQFIVIVANLNFHNLQHSGLEVKYKTWFQKTSPPPFPKKM